MVSVSKKGGKQCPTWGWTNRAYIYVRHDSVGTLMEIVAMGKRRGSPGPLPLFSRCCPVPDQIYESPLAWVDRPPFRFSFFPECVRSTVLFTNQYLLMITYGFIFRFLIPLAEDFGTWTQEASFTRIFCMRCIQDGPSVESHFSGLPCFCDLYNYEWSRLVKERNRYILHPV